MPGSLSRKDLVKKLLKGIETGDPDSAAVVNEKKYIQHNPQTHEGGEGLAALFKRISKSQPRVNVVRAYEDGDFVFGHTEYDFATRRVGFEIFRFEGNQAVEHWDNIQPRMGPNASGRSMVDGPTKSIDLELTETNRAFAGSFIKEVFVDGHSDKLDKYIDIDIFITHSPELDNGLEAMHEMIEAVSDSGERKIQYMTIHRVLAEGNFVLVVAEGTRDGVHTSFFNMFRLAGGKIVEHWDTVETVPPKSEWKNQNGKFAGLKQVGAQGA